MKPQIPFGPWLPDQPEDNMQGCVLVVNAVPAEAGYRLVNAPAPTGFKVNDGETILAAHTARDDFFTAQAIGTDKGIYYNGEQVFTCEAATSWSFCQYGGYIIAASPENDILEIDIATGATQAIEKDGINPPRCGSVDRIGEFLFSSNINDSPGLVKWSALGNFRDFVPSINSQSGEQELFREYGAVLTVRGEQYATAFQERAITRITYVGGDIIFRFDRFETQRGLVNAESVTEHGQNIYFLCTDGFSAWNGQQVINLDKGSVNKYARNNGFLSPKAILDPTENRILWTQGAEALCFSIDSKSWSLLRFDEDIQAGTEAETQENLNLTLYANGGEYTTTGEALEVEIITPEIQAAPKRRARLKTIWPRIDAIESEHITACIQTRYQSTGDPIETSYIMPKNLSGYIPVVAVGRFLRIKIIIARGATWVHAQGVDIEMTEEGTK